MCSWSKHFTKGPLWKSAVALLFSHPHLGYNLFMRLKSGSWTHEKTSGKDIIRFYFWSPNYSGTHLSDTQWHRSSSLISHVRNISCREVQGNSLLWFEGIESSRPESLLIPLGPVRCHLFYEALPKPKPKVESNNFTFLFHSLVLSLPESWSPVLDAFSVPLIQARNRVLFILISPQSRHRAVVQLLSCIEFALGNWIESTFPDEVFRSFPEGKFRPSKVGKGGPCKMRKSWYAIVLFVGRLIKWIRSFLPSQSHCG